MQRTCGAKRRDGGECMAPSMPNGRCRIHGGKSTGPKNPVVKHGLYRKRLTGDEQLLYDELVNDKAFDDLRQEIAMLRVMIDRCVRAIEDTDEWRVPMQVMPQYVEKLSKLIERMRPQATRLVMESASDLELQEMLNEENAARALERADGRE